MARKDDLSLEDQKELREREATLVAIDEDASIIALLVARDGLHTCVHLVDGRVLHVMNIAWGYDMEDPFAHVTTNASPTPADSSAYPIDFFFTDSVARITAHEDGSILFKPAAS